MDRVKSLEREINQVEEELTRASPIAAGEARLQKSTWRDIQAVLKPDEAAIEFVRFPFRDRKRWTTTSYYVALVVTPKSTLPAMFVLGEEKNLAGSPLNDYRKRVRLERDGTIADKPGFYDTFWKPMVGALGGAKRVYVSPDGVLNQISWSVAPGSQDLLAKEYALRIVAGTRELLTNFGHREPPSAVLLGDPTFDLSESEQRAAIQKLASPGSVSASESGAATFSGPAPLDKLPETRAEINAIHELLHGKNWAVEAFLGDEALKEVLKGVKGPRVLHIATHGFFKPAPPQRSGARPEVRAVEFRDAMLRSGLYLAGAGRTLRGQTSPDGLENGILTAYEASGLNLHGTELVVLSACDTGLGQHAGGEGVFGLQRALRQAGAESILMSMWAVPEDTTRELMVDFYSRWINGADKHIAFQEAQNTIADRLKRRWGRDLPEQWGAFSLVGR
jgi:CHAT domain-containing protein